MDPKIQFPDKDEDIKREISEILKSQRDQGSQLEILKTIIISITIVVAISFIAMTFTVMDIFIQHKNFTAEKYSELNTTLEESKRMIIEEKDKKVQDILSNISSEIERLSNNKK